MKIGQFRNARAQARFDAVYAQVLEKLWPQPRTGLDIATTFGATRVYRAGPSAGPAVEGGGGAPIVLLPGGSGNALMWHRHISALSRRHQVIAVDTVGEPGASRQTAPIGDGRDAAAWLEELLTALQVERAHLVGCSYGGWLILHHHLRHPGRAATLTLLDPAGLAAPGRRFFAWVIAGGLAGLAPRPLRPLLARLLDNRTILDGDLMRLVRPAMTFRRGLPPAEVLTDDQLRRIGAPSLFLLGERSTLHDSRQAAGRIARSVPDGRAEVVPGAGHALPADHPGLVTDRILAMAEARSALR
ncbi:alpha/beta fold hydrolase [Actinomadura macrotermitis]|uniref:Putative carboxylesterase nap n=1 Tax=Actinomadura macrotermitis TaxID=2585200 RepID=A0A7K0C2L3_9ACTN|nr:alpha/beta hydrolase [Actinomadura macrotermitis]MQY07658.1 putative carboxylesterase nap [Actinomadura macrotermitis]